MLDPSRPVAWVEVSRFGPHQSHDRRVRKTVTPERARGPWASTPRAMNHTYGAFARTHVALYPHPVWGTAARQFPSGCAGRKGEPLLRSARPFHVRRTSLLLLATMLGLAAMRFPQTSASASCAAPYVTATDGLVLQRGSTVRASGPGVLGVMVLVGCSLRVDGREGLTL